MNRTKELDEALHNFKIAIINVLPDLIKAVFFTWVGMMIMVFALWLSGGLK